MQNYEETLKWLHALGTAYLVTGFILAAAFSFCAVCAGIWLLRNSKLSQHESDEHRLQIRTRQDHEEEGDLNIALKRREQQQRFHEAAIVTAAAESEARKYKPKDSQ